MSSLTPRTIPVRQLRREVRQKGWKAYLAVRLEGLQTILFRVSKREVYRTIPTMKKRSTIEVRTHAGDMLIIGAWY